MNYITKRTLRYGIIMHISFTLTFLLFIGSVFLSTAYEDKTYWVIPLLLMVFTGPLTYDLYRKIKKQKEYRSELITFISVIKPIKGTKYNEIINAIGFESDTMYETIKDDKYVIRKWYALGYSFNAVFDSEDTIIEYNEVNEFKNR